MRIIGECNISGGNNRVRKGFIISCKCGNTRKIRADKKNEYTNWSCVSCKNDNPKKSKMRNSYKGLKQRCEYENHIQYKDYGGRGISCKWSSFLEFYEDMKDSWFSGASIDRIDVNGDYCKDNCKWSTKKEQVRNARSNKHTVDQAQKIREMYASGKYTQVELAKMFNDSQGNISNIILKRSWS